MSGCPIWVFATEPQTEPCLDLAGSQVEVFPLPIPEVLKHYPFGGKVLACARAEEKAPAEVQSLVWLDLECLVVQQPLLYDLGDEFDAALRPVHHRNVGLSPAEPLDAFWEGICHALGIQDVNLTVDSFIGSERLRAYFNTHGFSVRPGLGIFHRWNELFERLVCDKPFQETACRDEIHRIFLFQALLSALIASSVDQQRIRILPPTYNYPYNLHDRVLGGQRAAALNDLVTLTFEGRIIHPKAMTDIEIREPLRTWLETRALAGQE